MPDDSDCLSHSLVSNGIYFTLLVTKADIPCISSAGTLVPVSFCPSPSFLQSAYAVCNARLSLLRV